MKKQFNLITFFCIVGSVSNLPEIFSIPKELKSGTIFFGDLKLTDDNSPCRYKQSSSKCKENHFVHFRLIQSNNLSNLYSEITSMHSSG